LYRNRAQVSREQELELFLLERNIPFETAEGRRYSGDRALPVLSVQLLENSTGWKITFEGDFSTVARDLIDWFCNDGPDCALLPAMMRAETRLKALTAYQLLRLHGIKLVTDGEGGDRKSLTLRIPFETEA
jgi:hypothetical protein